MHLYGISKYKKLVLSLVFDAIGMLTVVDLIWAPVSGFLMSAMYKGNKGKIAGVLSFIEEAIPGLDVIPTFTLMWIYTYLIKRESPADSSDST
ncbi:MAG TPA: hypothetical protein VFF15_00280 [Flavobacteriaceae bacterium]|nr:hypothetical protein [Flavobacteriaceae bacterium]